VAGNDTPRVRRRRTAVTVIAAAVVTAATLGLIGWQDNGSKPGRPAANSGHVATTAVVRTDLSDARTLDGTLGHGTARALKGSGDGRVTWLPATGTTVTRGHQLYRVDDRPVPLFYGSTPLFRTLDTRGTVGRDVKVVADNLVRLGYDIGAQPAPGTWVQADRQPPAATPTASESPSADPQPSLTAVRVKAGDGILTASLVAAIKRWQNHVGMPATGVLGPGDAVVLPGAVRVAAVQAQPGDPADGQLMSLTSTGKKVTVQFDPTDVGSIRSGEGVTVTLPDNSTVHGSVAEVGRVVQGGGGSAGSDGDSASGTDPAQLTVTVSVDDTAAVRRLDSAPVQVAFAQQTRKGVLAVPVGALLALSEGGYAVQLPDGRLIAVKTGLFAKGRVEISGTGVRAGLKVVTTS
jgi:hypothetical protein